MEPIGTTTASLALIFIIAAYTGGFIEGNSNSNLKDKLSSNLTISSISANTTYTKYVLVCIGALMVLLFTPSIIINNEVPGIVAPTLALFSTLAGLGAIATLRWANINSLVHSILAGLCFILSILALWFCSNKWFLYVSSALATLSIVVIAVFSIIKINNKTQSNVIAAGEIALLLSISSFLYLASMQDDEDE